jgi:hypothetical protein
MKANQPTPRSLEKGKKYDSLTYASFAKRAQQTSFINTLYFQWAQFLATLPKALLPLCLDLRVPSRWVHILQLTPIRLFAPPLTSRLNIPPRRTAATQAHLHQPGENSKRARDPHEDKDGGANFRANVEFRHATNSVAEDDEHDGCNDGCDGDDERVKEREDGDG